MIDIIQTRIIHWKKEWMSLLFWLVFPILLTLLLITIVNDIQTDTKVPIGIVMEEETPLAIELYESIEANPLVRVYKLDEIEATYKLGKHELDSVFVIRKGYESNVRKNSRHRLILSYKSDLSLAYIPVSEMIVSYVQQDTGRSKAASVIKQLSEQYKTDQYWTWDEIIERSKIIQTEQSLLHTTFAFTNPDNLESDHDFTIFKTWSLWAIFALLATLLLSDWVIKEKRSSIRPRFAFMSISFKSYLLQNLVVMTVLLYLFDLLAMVIFYFYLTEPITLSLFSTLFFYRLTISSGAFLLALVFKNSHLYFSTSFALTLLIAIMSGAILPIEGIIKRFPWMETSHLFYALLVIFILSIGIWYARKEKLNA